MTEETKTLKVGEKVYSLEEIMAIQKQFAELQTVVKQAKKEGLIAKEEKVKAEKILTPEVQLFVSQMAAVIEANKTVIDKLYADTKTETDPIGQIGINFNKVFGDYGFQMLSETARKAKSEKTKAAKKAAEKKDETPETEQPKPDAP
jgi:hypothetical protein